jgi:hypothetical protein
MGGTLTNINLDYGSGFTGQAMGGSLLAGARYYIGADSAGFFIGGEVEFVVGNGYDAVAGFENLKDTQRTIQGELHAGYQAGTTKYYIFAGQGANQMHRTYMYGQTNFIVAGLGAEVDVTDHIAVRIEAELGRMNINACNNYQLSARRLSVGVICEF